MQAFQHQEHRSFLSDTWSITKGVYTSMWWWLIVAIRVVCGYFFPAYNILSTPFLLAGFVHEGMRRITFTWEWIGASLLVVLTYWVLYLSAKPALEFTHRFSHMVRGYWRHGFVLIGWFCIVTLLYWSIGEIIVVNVSEYYVAITSLGICVFFLAILSLFFIVSLFEFEQINIGEIFKRAYRVIVKNIPLIIGVGVVFVVAYKVLLYIDNMIYIDSMIAKERASYGRQALISINFAHRYAHAIFDFLFALPFLVITTTSTYYRSYKK